MNEDQKFAKLIQGCEDIKVPLKRSKRLIKTITEENHENGVVAVTKLYK